MRKALLVLSVVALTGVASRANEWPERPDWISKLPPNQWTFAKDLRVPHEPCSSDTCEAGLYAPPLMLSIRIERAEPTILVGFEGCGIASGDHVSGHWLVRVPSGQRVDYIALRIVSVVGHAAQDCRLKDADVDLRALKDRLRSMGFED